jgi:tRNA U54 and U55 pseudouridine synthase Pus10
MAWALLAAFVSQIVHLSGRDDEVARIIARSRPPVVEAEHYPGSIAMAEHKHET